MIQDTEHDLQTRIQELEKQIADVVKQLGDVHLRIAKAKALIEQYQRITGASSSYLLDALETLEGK